MIYEPKEDSFLLQKYVKKFASEKSVLDMGTGSGIQAEAAMDAMAEHVLAVDIDVKSVDKLSTRDYEVRRSDLFSRVDEKFDLIIFNPPYLPQNPDEDSESARATTGGVKGDEIIVRFLKSVRPHLTKEGMILMVLSSLTPRKRIDKILEKKGFIKEVLETKQVFMETLEVWKIQRKQEKI